MFGIKCASEDCRYMTGGSTRTLMYFPPIYDKIGRNINPDRNIATTEVRCTTCGKKWIVKERGNEQIELKEII